MKFMYNCREMTSLSSEAMDKKHSLFTRIKMAIHVAMCSNCRNYQNQMKAVEKYVRVHFKKPIDDESLQLSTEAKEHLKEILENQ